VSGRDEVSQRIEVVLAFAFPLLPQRMEAAYLFATGFVGVYDDIVALRGGWPETIHAASSEQLLRDDLIQQLVRIVEQLTRGFAKLRIIENAWILALQLPSQKER